MTPLERMVRAAPSNIIALVPPIVKISGYFNLRSGGHSLIDSGALPL